MEWSKVKSILIVLMLLANTVLGINIAVQYLDISQTEKNSVKDACTLLAQRGVTFDAAIFEEMPITMEHYSGTRSEDIEAELAKKMIGECSIEKAGGGITKYTSDDGMVTFRTGGFFEAEAYKNSLSADEYIKSIGLSAENDNNAFTMRLKSGVEVSNAKISCKVDDEKTVISGMWIFSSNINKDGKSAARAELIMGLLAILEEHPSSKIHAVAPVYMLSEERAVGVHIVPMWRVTLDSGDIMIDGMTKRLAVAQN